MKLVLPKVNGTHEYKSWNCAFCNDRKATVAILNDSRIRTDFPEGNIGIECTICDECAEYIVKLAPLIVEECEYKESLESPTAKLQEEVETLKAELAKHVYSRKWRDVNGYEIQTCVECHEEQGDSHDDDCTIGKLLA